MPRHKPKVKPPNLAQRSRAMEESQGKKRKTETSQQGEEREEGQEAKKTKEKKRKAEESDQDQFEESDQFEERKDKPGLDGLNPGEEEEEDEGHHGLVLPRDFSAPQKDRSVAVKDMTDADHSTAKEIEEPLDDDVTDPSYEPPRIMDDDAESEDMFDEDEERGDDETDDQFEERKSDQFDHDQGEERKEESDDQFEERAEESDDQFEERAEESDNQFEERVEESDDQFEERAEESDNQFEERAEESDNQFEERAEESDDQFEERDGKPGLDGLNPGEEEEEDEGHHGILPRDFYKSKAARFSAPQKDRSVAVKDMTDADHSTAKEIEEPLDDDVTDPTYEPPPPRIMGEDMFNEDEERGDDETDDQFEERKKSDQGEERKEESDQFEERKKSDQGEERKEESDQFEEARRGYEGTTTTTSEWDCPREIEEAPATPRNLKACKACGRQVLAAHLARHSKTRKAAFEAKKREEKQQKSAAKAKRAAKQEANKEKHIMTSQAPLTPELVDENEGRYCFWKVMYSYWASERLSQESIRNYSRHIESMMDFFFDKERLRANDLLDFWSEDTTLPKKLPSISGWKEAKENSVSVFTLHQAYTAYTNICRGILWILHQHPNALVEDGRRTNSWDMLVNYYSNARDNNKTNIKRSTSTVECHKTTYVSNFQKEGDEGTTTSEWGKYLPAYLESKERKSFRDELRSPDAMVELCKERTSYCRVRDFLQTELIMLGGANRGQAAVIMTHSQWSDSKRGWETTSDGKKIYRAAVLIPDHKTGKNPLAITVCDELATHLIDLFAFHITGEAGVIPAKGFKHHGDAPVFRNYDGSPMTSHYRITHVFRQMAKVPATKILRLHTLRNLFADWSFEKGIDVEKVAAAMSHSVETSRRYRTRDVRNNQDRKKAEQARDLGCMRKKVPSYLRDILLRLFPDPDVGLRPPMREWEEAMQQGDGELQEVMEKMRQLHPGVEDKVLVNMLRESYRAYHRNHSWRKKEKWVAKRSGGQEEDRDGKLGVKGF